MNRLNLTEFSRKLEAKRNALPVTAKLHDAQPVTDTLARAVFVISQEHASGEALEIALNRTLDGNMSVVGGSFRTIAGAATPSIIGFVRANKHIKPFEESNRYHVLQASMFMDKEDQSVWRVQEDASGNKFLVRQESADLGTRLHQVTAHVYNAPKLANIPCTASPTEFVAFVHPVHEEIRYGYVLTAEFDEETGQELLQVVAAIETFDPPAAITYPDENLTPTPPTSMPQNRAFAPDALPQPTPANPKVDPTAQVPTQPSQVGGEDPIVEAPQFETLTIDASLVVEVASVADHEREFASAELPADLNSKPGMISYYQRMYEGFPEYIAEIKRQIDSHSAL